MTLSLTQRTFRRSVHVYKLQKVMDFASALPCFSFWLHSAARTQGPGNYRDVVQNRRSDVIFNPRIGSFNVRMFLSFIQPDGYEPLSVEAVSFHISDQEMCDQIAVEAVGKLCFRVGLLV